MHLLIVLEKGAIMNIFELALERENYMHNLYKELAEKASSKGFKAIFEMMAKEEGKHIDIFENKSKDIPKKNLPDYFLEAQNVFENLKSKKEVFASEQDQLWLYCKMRDLEEENMKLYQREAENAPNEKLRERYKELAQEEFRHYEMMEEIVQFIGRPLTWVSCAETSSLKVY